MCTFREPSLEPIRHTFARIVVKKRKEGASGRIGLFNCHGYAKFTSMVCPKGQRGIYFAAHYLSKKDLISEPKIILQKPVIHQLDVLRPLIASLV